MEKQEKTPNSLCRIEIGIVSMVKKQDGDMFIPVETASHMEETTIAFDVLVEKMEELKAWLKKNQ